MKHQIKYLGLVIFLIFLSCSSTPGGASVDMAYTELGAPSSDQENTETDERKLIKEGGVVFESDNLSATRKTVYDAVEKYKGYVSSDQEYKSPGRKSNTLIIRVPAINFDTLLGDATKGVEKFDSKEINVKDVTEEFLDIQVRLKTKKELEQRYIDLLKQAQNVSEILEIEKYSGQLRTEIESIEGRLKYLQDRVSVSTLTMTFYERIPNETEFGQKIKNGFRTGWDNLIWFFIGLINIWPFILVVIGLIFGIKKYRKKK